ncbi:MAG: ABC transporter permease subunit [Verrucomicrobiales bacterium]|nr:ABC transporter permease subunit [Verrucomicrobiales bacterium]
MTFLPIVRRELTVASRRGATFRVRGVGALIAVALGGLYLLPKTLGTGVGGSGDSLLRLLGWLGMLIALLAGPMLTADSLSRERREGTLGFLFLTDLQGYDIVAGKLAGLALIPLHGLLATFPIAALTLCLGGVTAGEFWRTQLVVANTLFVSLTLGLWVSSGQTDDRRAVGITGGYLLALCFLPALAGATLTTWGFPGIETKVQAGSPPFLLFRATDLAYQANPQAFWNGFLFQHGLGWVALIAAGLVAQRRWRDATFTPAAEEPSNRGTTSSWGWQHRRRPRFAEGPLAWLSASPTWIHRGAWWTSVVVALVSAASVAILGFGTSRLTAGETAAATLGLGHVLLKCLLATQAVYFLQDACRNGTMEMLLMTPVTDHQLLNGHLAGLRRMILGPFLVVAGAQFALGIIGRCLAGGDWPSAVTMVMAGAVPPLFSAMVHAIDLVAVGIHASRWALHYDRPTKALLRTVLLVIILPSMMCSAARLFIDLIVIMNHRPVLNRFRETVRAWYFPGELGPGFGMPRSGH